MCAGTFMVGSLVGFLGAGPALFADGPMDERLHVLMATALAYFIIGVGAGALAPHMWKSSAFSLVLPLFPLAALYAADASSDHGLLLLVVALLLGDTAAALLGTLAGARWRLRHRM